VARCGVDGDRAVVRADQGGHDRQAKPRAAGLPGPGLISPVEPLEDAFCLARAKPRPLVGHLKDYTGVERSIPERIRTSTGVPSGVW